MKRFNSIQEIKTEVVRLLQERQALHIATQYLRHSIIGDAEVDNYMRMEQAGA